MNLFILSTSHTSLDLSKSNLTYTLYVMTHLSHDFIFLILISFSLSAYILFSVQLLSRCPFPPLFFLERSRILHITFVLLSSIPSYAYTSSPSRPNIYSLFPHSHPLFFSFKPTKSIPISKVIRKFVTQGCISNVPLFFSLDKQNFRRHIGFFSSFCPPLLLDSIAYAAWRSGMPCTLENPCITH